jgi:hypothetical protein
MATLAPGFRAQAGKQAAMISGPIAAKYFRSCRPLHRVEFEQGLGSIPVPAGLGELRVLGGRGARPFKVELQVVRLFQCDG